VIVEIATSRQFRANENSNPAREGIEQGVFMASFSKRNA
jgi:hypothetical protein